MKLFEDILKTVLNEDKKTKNRSRARNYMKNERNMTQEQADKIDKALISDLHKLKYLDYYYMLGVTRMYLDGQITNVNTIKTLNNFFSYAYYHKDDKDIKALDRDLNGMSCQELIDNYKVQMEEFNDEFMSILNREALNLKSNESKYYVVKIPDFDTASKFSEYTQWCVTNSDAAYNQYTDDGLGIFYFCIIKPEFVMNEGVAIQGEGNNINNQVTENNSIYISPDTNFNYLSNIPKEAGEGCPLDEYGLSMIAVSVTEGGSPNTITCRWNHDNGGSDNVMKPNELQQLTHFSYQNVFKVRYTKEELEKVKRKQIEEFIEAIKNGDAELWLQVDNKLNVYEYNEKYLVVDENNNPIVNRFFKYSMVAHHENMVIVENNDQKQNYLLGDGSYLLNEWVDECRPFKNGYAIIKNNNKMNYISSNGSYVLDNWVYKCSPYYDGYAFIKIDELRWVIIDTQGKPINDDYYLNFRDFFDDGYAIVTKHGHIQNYLLRDGSYLLDEWVDGCYPFSIETNTAYIKKDGKEYVINRQGEIIGEVDESFNHNDLINLLTENIIRVIFN